MSHAESGPSEVKLALPAKVIVSLRAGVVLALANIVCVIIFSAVWIQVKAEPKVISVTGSAKKTIQSDLIVWTGQVTVNDPELVKAYEQLKAATEKTNAYLRDNGIPANAITVSAVNTNKHFVHDDKGNITDKISSYELTQNVEITSTDVTKVAEVSRKVTELIQAGVLLDSFAPRYLYTKLADLKITMLAEATKDATARAQQIAGNSGATLGPIREARMGVMQINPVHSNEVSDGGNNDTSSFEKEITAVVSAKFSLE